MISSLGSWSKISKLLQVGDVKDFRSKSSLLNSTTTWKAFFCENYQFTCTNQLDIKSLQCPFGVKGKCTYEARRAEFRDEFTDGMGWDRWTESKKCFNFLHTLWIYRKCIYFYIFKNCHQYSYGFENLMSSWGSWSKF